VVLFGLDRRRRKLLRRGSTDWPVLESLLEREAVLESLVRRKPLLESLLQRKAVLESLMQRKAPMKESRRPRAALEPMKPKGARKMFL